MTRCAALRHHARMDRHDRTAEPTPARRLGLASTSVWTLALLWTLACPPAAAAALTGVVQRVVDGDSFFLDRPGQPPLAVRISNIDAPEICQPWGEEAKAALEALVLNQTVTARTASRDRQGRTLARVRVGELDVGQRLVADGHAWSARSRSGRGPALKQERVAASLRRGLHDSTGAVYPADFVEKHGPCPPPGSAAPAR
jgi:endonuclease YncB( thermonuclease family)